MMEIVEAKVSQCREFHDVLRNAPPKADFVESTYSNFWSSRQNIAGTKQTNKTAWARKNILGDIITPPPNTKKNRLGYSEGARCQKIASVSEKPCPARRWWKFKRFRINVNEWIMCCLPQCDSLDHPDLSSLSMQEGWIVLKNEKKIIWLAQRH